jgi:hypothetical protein
MIDATSDAGTRQNVWIELEFVRRQTIAQQQAAEAQGRAATPAEHTATYTRRNALFMLLSVIVLALSSVATFIISLLAYLN